MLSNNDVIRRLRYAFDFNDETLVAIFKEAGFSVGRADVLAWTKKDFAEGFKEMSDPELGAFLDGLINKNRGKKEGYECEPTKHLDNNLILRKLKIAFNFRNEDIIEIVGLGGKKLGKSELTAFFRKPEHKHYRICQDQILRNFLSGLALNERSNQETKAD
ncbi:MAG: DUF1456 family protein [Bacteroidia bacterium]